MSRDSNQSPGFTLGALHPRNTRRSVTFCLDIIWNASPAIMLSPTLPRVPVVRSCRTMQLSGWISMGDETMLSAVVAARANGGSETRFDTDNQPEGRGRPRGSPNKMSPAFKQMLLEVAEELGSVPYKDWDKLPCGDGLKGFLKTLAIQDPKAHRPNGAGRWGDRCHERI
jgi:hypothetical protein